MKTLYVKPAVAVRNWHIVDASGKILGRVAAEVAAILRGKNKPHFVPHHELGDYVVVINAAQIKVTGQKVTDKIYIDHTRFPGGIKSKTFGEMIKRKPVAPLEIAIRGMLPKNRLGRKLFNNVKVYSDGRHPHVAQKPQPMSIKE